MKRKIAVVLLFAPCSLHFAYSAEAQQPTKISPDRMSQRDSSPRPRNPRIEAFRQGLRELGYVEGKNIVIEYRYADGKLDRLPALAAELVRLKVDIIVIGRFYANPRRQGSNFYDSHRDDVTIPIRLATGFVASLARPGENITGLSNLAPELSGKRLEILRRSVPKLSRVAVIGTSTTPANAQVIKEVELAAKALGVKLQNLDVLDSKDIETAFRAASKGRADGVLVLTSANPGSSARSACRASGEEPFPRDVFQQPVRRSRRAYVLRRRTS